MSAPHSIGKHMSSSSPARSARKELTVLLVTVWIGLAAGCGGRHYSDMMLYKSKDGAFLLPKGPDQLLLGNNPIFVGKNAKISVELTSLNPGWLHQGDEFKIADRRASKISRDQSEHLGGNELWIVTRIVALLPNSPLEIEGKTYFKISNVKFGSQSFRSIPIDLTERRVFTHAADNSYRINIRVYEVDGFKLKRALLRTYRDNPGLWGIGESVLRAGKAMFGAITGQAVVDMGKGFFSLEGVETPLAVEAILLQASATLELQGTAYIYAVENPNSTDQNSLCRNFTMHDWYCEEFYLLYDKWKSDEWKYGTGESPQQTYMNAQAKTLGPIEVGTLDNEKAFIRFTVIQSTPASERDVNTPLSEKTTMHADEIAHHQALSID